MNVADDIIEYNGSEVSAVTRTVVNLPITMQMETVVVGTYGLRTIIRDAIEDVIEEAL